MSVALLSRVFNEKINKNAKKISSSKKIKRKKKCIIELDEMHGRLLMFRTTRR